MNIKQESLKVVFSLLMVLFIQPWSPAQAQNYLPSSGVDGRTENHLVRVVTHHWQLATWAKGTLVCDLYLRHEEFPSYGDVRNSCGDMILTQWLTTPACSGAASGNTANCKGVLLRYLGDIPITYTETTQLPGIEVNLTPYNCSPGQWCNTRPLLEIQAIEPLQGYEIQRVHIRIGDKEKTYNGDTAIFNLPLTGEQGNWLEYWAESSYGDQSDPVQLRYRSRVSDNGASFHFDLLDSAWKNALPSGTLLWQIFPPSSGVPNVLKQPESPVQLYTTDSYLYLAGYLIQSGRVDASNCSDGGLYLGGSASPCGKQMAEAQVIDWQNRYNAQILQAAQKYNIPAMLLKRIIAQESQFLGETGQPYEKGLGYMTAEGVDMILTWNTGYYLQNCLKLFEDFYCSPGYSNLDETRQNLLRKYILDKVGTPEEIEMLAAAIYASAAQSGQMVQNVSGLEPMYTTTYVDLWKITAGNYYGGVGCLSTASEEAFVDTRHITWDEITQHLGTECDLARDYVAKIMNE